MQGGQAVPQLDRQVLFEEVNEAAETEIPMRMPRRKPTQKMWEAGSQIPPQEALDQALVSRREDGGFGGNGRQGQLTLNSPNLHPLLYLLIPI